MPKSDSSSPDEGLSTSASASPQPHYIGKFKAKPENKVSKPRLTAHQKNTNHKDAENKRRNAIRDQFLALSHIVPGTEGQERSEFIMLQKTVSFLKEAMGERRQLVAELEARGGKVADRLKLEEQDWGGKDWVPRGVNEWERIRGKRSIDSADGEGQEEDD